MFILSCKVAFSINYVHLQPLIHEHKNKRIKTNPDAT